MTEPLAPEAMGTMPLLIVEIGTEEIPARFLPDGMTKLRDAAARLFTEYRVPCRSLRTLATPRRLCLISEVETLQCAAEREVWGPPANVAFTLEGQPTKAAEAFAAAHGLSVSDLSTKEKGKGLYVVAVIRESAHPTASLLPEILPKVILSLTFPKSMRWGDGTLRFARPIHWIFTLFNNEKIKFTVAEVKSGTTTRGHRFLSPAGFEIKDCRAYVNLLRNNFVILDPEERKRLIIEGTRKLALTANASVVEDPGLLEHVAFLVEYPVPVLGSFSPDYLSLPRELLVTVMKDHQKYFALEDASGNLVNSFIVVSNTRQDNADTVRKGAERVLKARFEDARFYYESDANVSSEERLEALKKVIYHERLGSLYHKAQRIAALADFFAVINCPAKREHVRTAALLCKNDLICGVVREFPELQGIMGTYYARNEGRDDEIGAALAEQYLPGHSGDRLPATDIGAIVSLSDKLDNLASFFMLGETPTGAEDPFALRRQAIATLAILADRRYDIPLAQLFGRALEPFNLGDSGQIIADLLRFFEQRFEPYYLSKGYGADTIAAVSHFLRSRPIFAIQDTLDALMKLKAEPEYGSLLTALKRVNNIAPKEEAGQPNERLFETEEESILHRQTESLANTIQSLLLSNQFSEALGLLLTLKDPINAFFERVLVMDKRDEVKQNRLCLIKAIQDLSNHMADFSKLT